MSESRRSAHDTTLCVIDTQHHALAARAMRLSLGGLDFADALFLSDVECDTGGARFVAIPKLAGREAYSRFVIKDLLRHIETEHVLLIQWDGYVVNPDAWTDDFLNYDYIGARWGFHNDAHNVGNGGFTLRSRKLLEALQDPEIDQFEPEDEKICRHYRPLLEARHGIRFAPAEVADRFSFETTYPTALPLGFHGLYNIWLFLRDDEVADFISELPRSVLGSVQALSLAGNFIDLKRLDSARALLQARLAAFPGDTRCAEMLAGVTAPAATSGKTSVSRNEPCPCGSGKRYKHCCGKVEPSPSSRPTPPPPQPDGDDLLERAMSDHQAGRLAQARQSYLSVLALGPNAIAEHYLGVLDMQEGRPEAGEARIRAALALRSDLPDFHNNLGLCLRAQGRLDEAVACYRRALELNPSYAPAWSNIGLDEHKLGHLEASLDAFERALVLEPRQPQTHLSRALVLLALGDYARGWQEYEWRRHCPEYAAGYRLPELSGQPQPWQGEPLAGKRLLLIAEQGIGDTIQFIRYAQGLAEQGARIGLYLPRPHLADLLRSVPGIAEIHVADAGRPIPEQDYFSHLVSLPRLCGTHSIADVPAPVPYLAASPERRAVWRRRLEALPHEIRIGLAWTGNPNNPDDRHRSAHLSALAPLFDLPGVAWISLQLGPGREQLQSVPNPVLDWGDAQTDYAETAALMAELDLIVTVDTSIAHAAGALGLPVWVMLSHMPDFRWLLGRDDSPWYPTARLFRQPAMGDWIAVAREMRDALHKLKEHAA